MNDIKVNFKIPVSLAAEIGCSIPFIYKINDGSRRPSLSMSRRIIRVMQDRGIPITLEDLRPDLVKFGQEITKLNHESQQI